MFQIVNVAKLDGAFAEIRVDVRLHDQLVAFARDGLFDLASAAFRLDLAHELLVVPMRFAFELETAFADVERLLTVGPDLDDASDLVPPSADADVFVPGVRVLAGAPAFFCRGQLAPDSPTPPPWGGRGGAGGGFLAGGAVLSRGAALPPGPPPPSPADRSESTAW